MSLYERATSASRTISENGRKAYDLALQHSRLLLHTFAPHRAFERNHPRGYLHFTQDDLAAVGARYLQIDTFGPNGHVSYGARLSMRIIEIRSDEAGLYAADTASGALIARITNDSFNESNLSECWQGFCPGLKFLLPLAGPILRHPVCARLADLANDILSGPLAETIREIEAIEEDLDSIEEAGIEIRTKILETAQQHILAGPVDTDLTDLLSSHDWAYDEADRPPSLSRTIEQQEITAMLAELTLDDATALFVIHNKPYWNRSLAGYLYNHPGLQKIAA